MVEAVHGEIGRRGMVGCVWRWVRRACGGGLSASHVCTTTFAAWCVRSGLGHGKVCSVAVVGGLSSSCSPCPPPACGRPGQAHTEQPSGPQLVLRGGPQHVSRALEHPARLCRCPRPSWVLASAPGTESPRSMPRGGLPRSPLPSLVLVLLSPVHLPCGPFRWTQGPHREESPALGKCRLSSSPPLPVLTA